MSKKYHDGSKYLIRIVQHITRLFRYFAGGSLEEYKKKELLYDAVNMQISLMGEQVQKLRDSEDKIIDSFTDIKWAELIAIRNRVTHDYTSIAPKLVWDFIENELPVIDRGIRNILLKRYGMEDIPGERIS